MIGQVAVRAEIEQCNYSTVYKERKQVVIYYGENV